jgi:hypothetical protein
MGEHHRNINAAAKRATPPAVGQTMIQLAMQRRIKPQYLVGLSEDRIRKNAEGHVEVQDAAGRWGVLPEGMEILPPGADGIQHWDIVVGLVAAQPTGVAALDGQQAVRMRWLRDLHVEDMGAFFAALEPPKPVAPVTA